MLSKVEITRKRLALMRNANRMYFEGKDKKDPRVAQERREMAEDTRYFHQKWLNAKQS